MLSEQIRSGRTCRDSRLQHKYWPFWIWLTSIQVYPLRICHLGKYKSPNHKVKNPPTKKTLTPKNKYIYIQRSSSRWIKACCIVGLCIFLISYYVSQTRRYQPHIIFTCREHPERYTIFSCTMVDWQTPTKRSVYKASVSSFSDMLKLWSAICLKTRHS